LQTVNTLLWRKSASGELFLRQCSQ